jgi:hypothetical protein
VIDDTGDEGNISQDADQTNVHDHESGVGVRLYDYISGAISDSGARDIATSNDACDSPVGTTEPNVSQYLPEAIDIADLPTVTADGHDADIANPSPSAQSTTDPSFEWLPSHDHQSIRIKHNDFANCSRSGSGSGIVWFEEEEEERTDTSITPCSSPTSLDESKSIVSSYSDLAEKETPEEAESKSEQLNESSGSRALGQRRQGRPHPSPVCSLRPTLFVGIVLGLVLWLSSGQSLR